MNKTNFDQYLEEQLQGTEFSARFERACEAWDVGLQIAALRRQAGFSQKDLARLLKTSQQQISRLESASYQGHSLSMLRRVAEALHARVRVVFEPVENGEGAHVAEDVEVYGKSLELSRAYEMKRMAQGVDRGLFFVTARLADGVFQGKRGRP